VVSTQEYKQESERWTNMHSVHRRSHCLNLVLVDCVKSDPDAARFCSSLERLYVFFSSSCVHHKWLEEQSELIEGEPRELQRSSDTGGFAGI